MKSIGTVLASLIAFALLAIGLGAIALPGPSSEQYGLPARDPSTLGYVRALGARDVVLGLIIAAFTLGRARGPLGVAVGYSTIVAAADFLIVLAVRGPEAGRNLATHGAGVAGLAVAWAAIRANQGPPPR